MCDFARNPAFIGLHNRQFHTAPCDGPTGPKKSPKKWKNGENDQQETWNFTRREVSLHFHAKFSSFKVNLCQYQVKRNQIVFLGLPRIGEIRLSNMFCHVTDHAIDMYLYLIIPYVRLVYIFYF